MRIPVSVLPAKHCQHRFAWVFMGAESCGLAMKDGGWRMARVEAMLSSEQCEHHVDSVISWSPSECAERDLPLPNFCVLSFAAALNIHVGQIRVCFCFFWFFVFCFLFSCVLYQNIINKFACRATAFLLLLAARRRLLSFLPLWPRNFLIKCSDGHVPAVGGYFTNLKLHFTPQCQGFLWQ